MPIDGDHWDVSNITSQLRALYNECVISDPQKALEIKKDIYQIKFFIDSLIKDLPQYQGEEKWLNDQEAKRLIKILKME